MRPALDGRTTAVLLAAAAPPLAFVLAGRGGAPTPLAVASILAITAGLAVLERELRGAGLASVSVAASLLTLYGTGLLWHEVVEPGPTALAFVAGTLLVRAWGRSRGGSSRGRDRSRRGAGSGFGRARASHRSGDGPGAVPRPSIAARQPLLVAPRPASSGRRCSGHRRHRPRPARRTRTPRGPRRADRPRRPRARERQPAPLVERTLRQRALPSRAAAVRPRPGHGPGSACARPRSAARCASPPSRAACSWPGTCSSWSSTAPSCIPRDDTVSFPGVAENSARLLAGVAGSPIAWPANWIFAARHGLPAARYDLLAGPGRARRDGRARAIDVGDLGRDAALLRRGLERAPPVRRRRLPRGGGPAPGSSLPVVDVRRATVVSCTRRGRARCA